MRVAIAFASWLALLGPTAASAARLPTTVAPEHYDLTFDVDLAGARFTGAESVRVRVKQRTTQIVLNAVDLQIQDVTIASAGSTQRARVTFDAQNETATLTVNRPIGDAAEVRLRFSGVLTDKLRGFYISRTPRRKYAVTQFESTDARRAFPCFDEPALKATFALTLTVDAADTAISNGALLSDVPGPGRAQHTLKFATSPKMSSYLVAMAIGDFRCLTASQDGIPLRTCAVPEKAALGRIALDAAGQILKYLHGYYAIRYPFGKLDLVAVPDFAAGGMENTAAIFFREVDLLADDKSASAATRKNVASYVAHEVAHQWFGNLVTMAWWDDLWLNEGLATWMATRPLAAAHPEWHLAVDEATESQAAMALDALKSTHSIRVRLETPAEIEAAFDTITYEKGAAVLRMVEHYVGAEAFRAGVNDYLRAHAYGNARAEDFWLAVAKASGRPVDAIMPTFVDRPGVPLLALSLQCDADRAAARAELSQQPFSLIAAPSAVGTEGTWRIPVCVKVDGSDPSGACHVLEESRQVISLARGCPSWVFANSAGRGYYRTVYPPAMLRALAPQIEASLDAPERLTLLNDEWALVQARRHSVADFLTVASGFRGEQVGGVLAPLTERLGFIGQYLTPDAARERFRRFIRSLFRPSFDLLGMNGNSGEGDDRRELRASVVAVLGQLGADADLIAQSRAAVDRALAGGPPLDTSLADTTLRIAAANGDARLFDAYLAEARRSRSPEEQYRYLFALPSFDNAALIERALQAVRSPEFRTQDTARYLAQFFANPAARTRAWAFLKEHWAELEPKVKVAFGDVRLVSSLAAFCDASAADDIRAFFTLHPLPAAGRALDETIERIANCVELRRAESGRVAEALDSIAR